LKHYTEDNIEKLIKNNSVEFFDALKYIDEETYIKIIEKVCKKNEVDYFDLAYQALNKDISSWNVSGVLKMLIPYSQISIDNILKFYELLHSKEDGTPFEITELLVKKNFSLAQELLKILFKDSKSFSVPHISAILVGLHNSHNENQYGTVIKFLKDKDIFKFKCVIGTIYLFDFSDEELKEICNLFKEKVKLSNEEIDRELLYSSRNLIKKGYEYFSEIILLYIHKDDITLKSHISQILYHVHKNHIEKDWFKKSFLSITNIDIEQQNIIYHIESILNGYLEKNDFLFIKKFLYKWIEKGNLSSLYTKTTLSIFTSKFNKYRYFSQFITEALVYENSDLHQILPKLIMEKELKLDIKTMEHLTIDDYLYLCRKILGYFHEFEIMNSMIFSILSVGNLQKEVREIIISILVDYIGQEYQYNTLEYLKNLEDDTINENEKEVKKIVISKLIEKKENRKELSNLKELLPPSQQNRIISRVQGVTMEKAMTKSRREDSFLSLFFGNEIMLRYGKGSFYEMNGEFTNVMYLQSHSHSITMPSSSQSQPIHYELERYNFRIAKKGL